MSIPTGRAFAKALEEAGVISDLNSITRVIIDIQPGDLVRVYVERVGENRLLDAFSGPLGMMLAEHAPEPEYAPEHAAGCALMLGHKVPDECQASTEGGDA